jgi:hypothetical protein
LLVHLLVWWQRNLRGVYVPYNFLLILIYFYSVDLPLLRAVQFHSTPDLVSSVRFYLWINRKNDDFKSFCRGRHMSVFHTHSVFILDIV